MLLCLRCVSGCPFYVLRFALLCRYEAPEDTSQGSGQLVADQDSFEFVMHQRNAASEYFPALADVNLVPLEAVGTASVQILNYIQVIAARVFPASGFEL